MKEAKKMKCYNRPTLEKRLQVSGLYDALFLSYLPKRFTQIYRALYGDAMLVYNFSTPIWPPNHLNFYDGSAFSSLVSSYICA